VFARAPEGRVDGERLEGRGVAPDIEVPFDFRYADGADPQLDRALEVLSRQTPEKKKGVRPMSP